MKKAIVRELEEKDIRWLEKGLKGLGFFSKLSVRQMATILPHMTAGECPKGHVVVKEGAKGNRFYLIQKGRVEVLKGKKRVATLKGGQFFGEMALLYRQRRNATVRCATSCTLLSLGNLDLQRILRKNPSVGKQVRKVAEARRIELLERE